MDWEPNVFRRWSISEDNYVPLYAGLIYGAEGKEDLQQWVCDEFHILNDIANTTHLTQTQPKRNKQVICLLGDAGSGKSTFTQHLERLLWRQWTGKLNKDIIPLYISLPRLAERWDKKKNASIYGSSW